MRKIVLTLSLIFAAFTMVAQDNIAVFVYSVSKLNEPINALRSSIVGALVNNVDDKYKVVDRSSEFAKILNMEFGYQEQGFVSDNQLIDAGKQMGANKVCGVVITDYGQDGGGYQIECNIIDIESGTVEKHADYPHNDKDELVYQLNIINSKKVAKNLAKQLLPKTRKSSLPTFEYNGKTYMVAPEPSFTMNRDNAYSYCENLTLDGYSDWFLPYSHMLTMCSIKNTIGLSGIYWTSKLDWRYHYVTEYTIYFAFNTSSCEFIDIDSYYSNKTDCNNKNCKYKVRPIREVKEDE